MLTKVISKKMRGGENRKRESVLLLLLLLTVTEDTGVWISFDANLCMTVEKKASEFEIREESGGADHLLELRQR